MSELPPGWEWSTIGDVVDVLDSRRVPVNAAERACRPGTVPYFGATGQVGWIDEALFDEELVLLGEDGAPFLDPAKRKAYLIAGPSWVNNHAHVLRAARGITSNRFLRHALDAADYRPFVNGTTRLKLTQKSMRSMPIPVPPRAEQERIVDAIEEHLSRLDAADEALSSATQRIGRLRLSLVQEAVEGDWETRPLGDVLRSLRNGCFVSRPALEPPGIPIYRISAVRPLALDTDDVRYAPEALPKADGYRVSAGDLLFTRYSGNPAFVGACAVVPTRGEGRLHPDKLIRGIPDTNLVVGEWMALVVSSASGRREVEKRLKTTAGQVGISGAQLKSVPIPVPPLLVQAERIGRWRQATEEASRAFGKGPSAASSEALRRSILADAFSGKLVPQDPNDEPASVLLDRIRAERAAGKPKRRARVGKS